MTHKSIQINNLELLLPHKTCFANFSAKIYNGNRIAITGRNGSGKSTLMQNLRQIFAKEMVCGYVPQIIEDFNQLSGGQRFNKLLTQALCIDPDILMLDEPTNNLDNKNRHSLMRMLTNYDGTLIIVSHDIELLDNCIDILWHIDNNKINIFSGKYSNYIQELYKKRIIIEQEISKINHKTKDAHQDLMKQQQRAAKSKTSGEKKVANRRWLKSTGDLKGMHAEKSQGKKLKNIEHKKNGLAEQLVDLRQAEIILPKFSLTTADISNNAVLSIACGQISYAANKPIIKNISLSLNSKSRIAILGDNGSGKSSLIKAILNDQSVIRIGDWCTPEAKNIGYLDQHYSTLPKQKTVFEIIAELMPQWSNAEIRSHLSDFLFRKNEEVDILTKQLSGGEKARLSLAQIAAKPPKLLILDEITNNLDLETRNHVINVLNIYPGAMIIVSHDYDFLSTINIKEYYEIKDYEIVSAN